MFPLQYQNCPFWISLGLVLINPIVMHYFIGLNTLSRKNPAYSDIQLALSEMISWLQDSLKLTILDLLYFKCITIRLFILINS